MVAQRSTRARRSPSAPVSALHITEKAWMAQVIELAQRLKWAVYHTHDSRRSAPGFPDLVMLRDGRMIVCELKTLRGKLTDDQRFWLDQFAQCDGVERVEVWRPNQLQEIVEILR